MKKSVLLAGLLIGCGTAAVAHEAAGHKAKTAQIKKEQKPWGIAANARDAGRTIRIAMSDKMRFTPDLIDVKQGETVKFIVRNGGKMLHEMVIGTKEELDAHAGLMVRFPAMEHDEPYVAHVSPGKASQLAWTFNRAGEFDFACLIPGHYQSGMVGKIRVTPQGKQ
jgi:uncharacterized cupredoxin-like copper-binding protein